ncbi:oligosaccharide flippase family protein [uncultured Azohydromonas sp.]|uniref:oligosaccharide flippase family protein n=1 Tax=uncultured Azohydromonas sp. TaxID=487342 RepID=UPI002606BAF6|nr:oligosaccharide flippase family protein [uncultured Azohydromonas sp.]
MSIRKSLAYSLIDRYASLAINIVSTMILARLLTPDDVGAFSVTMVIIAMMANVRDLGAGQYLVQEKELTHERIRAVWAVQLGLGVLLALVVLALSVPASLFYNDTRVRDVMFVLAVGYLVNPFGSVTYAWLMREMRYDATAVIRLSYTLASAGTSIFLAWRGFGTMSLAWGSLAGTVANALVATLYRPHGYPWLPGLREVRKVLSFGTRITGSSLATTLAKGAPEFFLGKLQSLTAAGFYSRANGMVALFNRLVFDAASVVATSGFAKQMRESKDLREPFLLGTAHVLALCWAFAGALAFLASPLTRLLYGPQWEPSAELARWLAGALALAAPVPLCLSALTGTGAAALALRASLLSAAVAVPLYLLGASQGLQAMGAAALAAEGAGTLFWLGSARSVVGFSWSSLAVVAGRSAVVGACASVGPALVYAAYGRAQDRTVTALLLGAAGSAVGFLAGLLLARHPLLGELRRLLRRKAPEAHQAQPGR